MLNPNPMNSLGNAGSGLPKNQDDIEVCHPHHHTFTMHVRSYHTDLTALPNGAKLHKYSWSHFSEQLLQLSES